MIDRNAPFPLEWNAWRELWTEWLAEKREAGVLGPTSWRFPGKNFLADEVLGTFSLDRGDGTGSPVELSEVTFPDFGTPRLAGGPAYKRYVGVTFGTGVGSVDGGVCATFADLEEALGISAEVSR